MSDDKEAADSSVEQELSSSNELVATEQLLAKALGGWRGMLDSALPALVFLLTFTLAGNEIQPAAIAAVSVAAVLAILRLIQRKSLEQVIGGLIGVVISAYFASRTGKAEDFFVPGLLLNLAYGVVIALSAVFRYPVIGFIIGGFQGDLMSWRQDSAKLRLYTRLSWFWSAVFALRLIVKTPLYFFGEVQVLGTVHLLMGWPLYLAAVYVTYRVVRANQNSAAVQ